MTFDPAHPLLSPPPPSRRAILTCFLSHHLWTLSHFRHDLLLATYLCHRCSKTMTVDIRFGILTHEPEFPTATQE